MTKLRLIITGVAIALVALVGSTGGASAEKSSLIGNSITIYGVQDTAVESAIAADVAGNTAGVPSGNTIQLPVNVCGNNGAGGAGVAAQVATNVGVCA